jgi:hypothetical protein
MLWVFKALQVLYLRPRPQQNWGYMWVDDVLLWILQVLVLQSLPLGEVDCTVDAGAWLDGCILCHVKVAIVNPFACQPHCIIVLPL